MTFVDDVRAVDYLVTRPEVDPDRIGCVGLSVGGLRSCHLAALDDRIKAAVVVGWMATYSAQIKGRIRHTIGFTKLVPGLMRHLDYPDGSSPAIPAALLVISSEKDGLFDFDGVRGCFAKRSACYAKAGIAERLQGRLYDAPHEFDAEMQPEAWDWLARWLRGTGPGSRARGDGPNGILSLGERHTAGAQDLAIAEQGATVDRRPIPGLEASTSNQGRRQPSVVGSVARFGVIDRSVELSPCARRCRRNDAPKVLMEHQPRPGRSLSAS